MFFIQKYENIYFIKLQFAPKQRATVNLNTQSLFIDMDLKQYIQLLEKYSGIFNCHDFFFYWENLELAEKITDYLNSILIMNKL